MHLYLSSFGFGNEVETLKRLAAGRRLAFIPNAADQADARIRDLGSANLLKELRELGIRSEMLDLAHYFEDPAGLRSALEAFDGVWVRGGNAFVLRKAMQLSTFDRLIRERLTSDFLYAGYSAGVCVLGPSLRGLHHVDQPEASPYADSEIVWEGLGILDYLILPHFQSDHHESTRIDDEVAYCRREGIPFRPLRDGEVLIFEDFRSEDSE